MPRCVEMCWLIPWWIKPWALDSQEFRRAKILKTMGDWRLWISGWNNETFPDGQFSRNGWFDLLYWSVLILFDLHDCNRVSWGILSQREEVRVVRGTLGRPQMSGLSHARPHLNRPYWRWGDHESERVSATGARALGACGGMELLANHIREFLSHSRLNPSAFVLPAGGPAIQDNPCVVRFNTDHNKFSNLKQPVTRRRILREFDGLMMFDEI